MENTEKQKIQEDITRIRGAIANLQVAGKDLFSEEIANLTTKLKNAEAELENAGQEAEKVVQTWTEKFRLEHGISVPVAVVVGGYIVWQVAAAIGRALGAI